MWMYFEDRVIIKLFILQVEKTAISYTQVGNTCANGEWKKVTNAIPSSPLCKRGLVGESAGI